MFKQPASDYDEMVDWDKRLAREAPFFRDLFDGIGVNRLADVGCGTGKHAIMFSSWGIDVIGIDPSEEMLAQARINANAANAPVPFVAGGYGGLGALLAEPVDAIVTLGNGLPHVAGSEGLRAAVEDFATVLRPGGVLVLHFLNHDRLRQQHPAWLPPSFKQTSEGPRIYAKVLEYADEGIWFDFVTVTRGQSGEWTATNRRSLHTWILLDELLADLAAAGFVDEELFGGHDRSAFDVASDESVIVVAQMG